VWNLSIITSEQQQFSVTQHREDGPTKAIITQE